VRYFPIFNLSKIISENQCFFAKSRAVVEKSLNYKIWRAFENSVIFSKCHENVPFLRKLLLFVGQFYYVEVEKL